MTLPFFKMCVSLVVLCRLCESEEESWTPINESYDGSTAIILWWTPFTHTMGLHKHCNMGSCYFTEDRRYLDHPNTRLVVFYGSDFSVEDLPIPRPLNQWWAVLHEESPRNNPLFDHLGTLELFNLTGTFRQTSDFPLTLLSLSSLEALTSQEEFVSTKRKNEFMKKERLAPVVYVQSDCDTPADRDTYVRELSRHIDIDSYGNCLNTKQLPRHLSDGAASHNHPEFRKMMANYKFSLAIENAGCDDYITEKLWRPLTLGSIPLYWGAATVSHWLPNPESAILISDFDRPKELSEHLNKLLDNDTMYDGYLAHKLEGRVGNKKLIDTLASRKWGVDDPEELSFIEEFECFLCDQILTRHPDFAKTTYPGDVQASLDHYGCPEPRQVGSTYPSRPNPDPENSWVREWHKTKIEAAVLNKFARKNVYYTAQEFYEEVIDRLQTSGYFNKFPLPKEEL